MAGLDGQMPAWFTTGGGSPTMRKTARLLPAYGVLSLTTPKSAAQLVYDQLKRKIIDFEIYPGTRLTESEIAEDFQVSRTPVCAALQRLETEGQITILPKQGCFVRSVDIETISQYYDVRIMLEASAVELACDYMGDEDLDALQEDWNADRQAVIETCEEHSAICQLIRDKNKTQARRAMTKHIRKSQELARSVTLSQLQQAIKRHKI